MLHASFRVGTNNKAFENYFKVLADICLEKVNGAQSFDLGNVYPLLKNQRLNENADIPTSFP